MVDRDGITQNGIRRDNNYVRHNAKKLKGDFMMRFDERYDEFGYERDDDDYEEQINEFLTPREVMELLAIGRNTFYKMVQSGQLPAFRIGRQWRVRRDRLEEL